MNEMLQKVEDAAVTLFINTDTFRKTNLTNVTLTPPPALPLAAP